MSIPAKVRKACSVDGCNDPSRSGVNAYCEVHYYRLRRTGTTDKRAPAVAPEDVKAERCDRKNERRRRKRHDANPGMQTRHPIAGKTCNAESCDKPMEVGKSGYCRMHDLRLKVRGDLDFEMRGENHPAWSGDEATYYAIHQRVRRELGAASNQRCVDCGGRAAQWSYDRMDEAQRVDPQLGPYSTDLSHYEPRCVSCHKKFDLQHVAAERAQ